MSRTSRMWTNLVEAHEKRAEPTCWVKPVWRELASGPPTVDCARTAGHDLR